MRRRRRGAACVTVVTLLVTLAATLSIVALPACSESAAPGGATVRTYRNEAYGFAIDIDDRFEEWQRADVADRGAFAVTFADKDGPTAGDRYLDAVMIAVVDLGTDLGTAQTESMRDLLREQSTRALDAIGSGVRTWPAEEVTVNGLTGSVVPFTASVGQTDVTGWTYLFVRQRFLYLVTVTSADDTWGDDRVVLQRMAESFRLDGE